MSTSTESLSLRGFDDQVRLEHRGWLAGVDEVGRGALAGPVVAAAVVLPPDAALPGVTDSKRLSRGAREEAYGRICSTALAWGVGEVGPLEIDAINIRQATLKSMRQAVESLSLQPSILLVDGRDDPGCGVAARTVVKGDSRSLSIAAASILAKVTRDRAMVRYAETYPGYGLERNVGYGTLEHRNAIRDLGTTPLHRFSFLGSILQERLDL